MSIVRKLILAAIVGIPVFAFASLFRFEIVDTPYGYLKHDRWTGSIERCVIGNKNRFKGGPADWATMCHAA